ncbi:hypothetical protein K439DRAFT_1616627 [Ramaria rubella]|nr:hypothetical protein K439DRAFT_1616627 [Ramaria rubella]
MSRYTLSVYVFTVVIGGFAAILDRQTFSQGSTFLGVRQTLILTPENIPSQCTSICAPYFTDQDRCGTADSCLCTVSVAQALTNCATCYVGVFPSALNELEATGAEEIEICNAAGFALSTQQLTNVFPVASASSSAKATGTSTSVSGVSSTETSSSGSNVVPSSDPSSSTAGQNIATGSNFGTTQTAPTALASNIGSPDEVPPVDSGKNTAFTTASSLIMLAIVSGACSVALYSE